MPTTSWGLRYPVSSAAPTVAQDIQNLATDVQTYTLPRFASIAARNAALPSPQTGQAAIVAGIVHTYDGSGWRFTLTGKAGPVGTDANGIFGVQHGAGQAPIAWGVSLRSQTTDAINTYLGALAFGEDSTNLNVRFVRYDTNAYFVGTVYFSWWARF